MTKDSDFQQRCAGAKMVRCSPSNRLHRTMHQPRNCYDLSSQSKDGCFSAYCNSTAATFLLQICVKSPLLWLHSSGFIQFRRERKHAPSKIIASFRAPRKISSAESHKSLCESAPCEWTAVLEETPGLCQDDTSKLLGEGFRKAGANPRSLTAVLS